MKNFKKNVMYVTVAVLALSGVTVKSNIFSDMWKKAKKDPAKAIGIGLGTAAVLGTAGYGTKKAYDYKKGLAGKPLMPALRRGIDKGFSAAEIKAGEFASKAQDVSREARARGQERWGKARGQVRAFGQDRGLIEKTSAEKVFGTKRPGAAKGRLKGFGTRYGF